MKTIEEYFYDWEAHVFGYGYGTGEPYTLQALKDFLALCPDSLGYDYKAMEEKLGPTTAIGCHTQDNADISHNSSRGHGANTNSLYLYSLSR